MTSNEGIRLSYSGLSFLLLKWISRPNHHMWAKVAPAKSTGRAFLPFNFVINSLRVLGGLPKPGIVRHCTQSGHSCSSQTGGRPQQCCSAALCASLACQPCPVRLPIVHCCQNSEKSDTVIANPISIFPDSCSKPCYIDLHCRSRLKCHASQKAVSMVGDKPSPK